MRYGILDVQDKCWLGTNEAGDGPKTFAGPQLAEVAREVACKQLRWPNARLVVREFNGGQLRRKDEVPTVMDAETALAKLEAGL